MDDWLVPDARLARLPDEVTIRRIDARGGITAPGNSSSLILTDARVVELSRERLLGVIPSAHSLRTARIEDIESAGKEARRMNGAVLLFGVLVLLAGLSALSREEARSGGTVGAVLGAIVVLAWVLIQRQYLAFGIASGERLSLRVYASTTGTDFAMDFLNTFQLLKAGHAVAGMPESFASEPASPAPSRPVRPPSPSPFGKRPAAPAETAAAPETPSAGGE